MYLLSDMFSRIRVASKRRLPDAIILNSKICRSGLLLIQKLGYIIDFQFLDLKYLRINLRYFLGACSLRVGSILSRPRLRNYVSVRRLRSMIYNNKIAVNGFFVCSTSRYGLATDVECILAGTAGEILFFVG
jgi:ribosomal protein S8